MVETLRLRLSATPTFEAFFSSRKKVVPHRVQVPYESGDTERGEGERQVALKKLTSHSSLRLIASPWSTHPLWPGHPPLCPPLPAENPWACPWCMAGIRPIRHQEWWGGENGCFLSIPYLGWTEGSAIVNIHLYVNGLMPGMKFWKFWMKTSIYPTLSKIYSWDRIGIGLCSFQSYCSS